MEIPNDGPGEIRRPPVVVIVVEEAPREACDAAGYRRGVVLEFATPLSVESILIESIPPEISTG